MSLGVRIKLSIMMFLQYAIWGSWAVSMGGYMQDTLKFTGGQIAQIYGTTAIAAILTPISIGYIADRFVATQFMIALLHGIGGLLLLWAAHISDFWMLFGVMMTYALVFMPTLSLTNSISFANIPSPEKDFPGIRVFGTWGWIVAGWIVGLVLLNKKYAPLLPEDYRGGNAPIILAGILSLVMAGLSLTLPHTPPKSKSDSNFWSFLGLLSDPSFLVFVICSFLICVPLAFYYSYANAFLAQIDTPYPTAVQTIGQISEVFFMAAMPYFIMKLGVKKMLIVGMLAWSARYLMFGSIMLPLVLLGLVLHGVCYDFFFVASQIYVDTRAKPEERASAQGFIALVTLGIGMYFGNLLGGMTYDYYPPVNQTEVEFTSTDAQGNPETKSKMVSLPDWDLKGEKGFAKEAGLEKDQSELTFDEIPKQFVETNESEGTKTVYTREKLTETLKKIDSDNNNKISHAEWRMAQRRQWPMIWLWPAVWAFATCAVFVLFFKPSATTAPDANQT